VSTHPIINITPPENVQFLVFAPGLTVAKHLIAGYGVTQEAFNEWNRIFVTLITGETLYGPTGAVDIPAYTRKQLGEICV